MNSSNAPLFAKTSDKEFSERPQAVRMPSSTSAADSTLAYEYESSAVLLKTASTVAPSQPAAPSDELTGGLPSAGNEERVTPTPILPVPPIEDSSAMNLETDAKQPVPHLSEVSTATTIAHNTEEKISTEALHPVDRTADADLLDEPVAQTSSVVLSPAEHTDTALVPEPTTQQPGAYLKYIREQKGLSIQYVADHLYLGVNVIESLEIDDYANLPSPIFVRGYLNNYARLLEIDAEPVIEGYKNSTVSTPLPPLTQVKQKVVQPTSPYKAPPKRTRVPTTNGVQNDTAWLPFLIIGVLIGLASLGLFWLIYPQSSDLLISSNPALGMNNDVPSNSSAIGEPTLAPAGTPFALSESVGLQNDNDSVEYAYTPPVEESLNDDPSEQALALQPPERTAMSLADNAVIEVPTATQPDNAATAVETNNQLKIHYTTAASWTRVVDVTGGKLFEGTKQAGESLVLQGQPPFTLRFGVMRGVQVEYQGEILSVANSPLRQGNNIVIGE